MTETAFEAGLLGLVLAAALCFAPRWRPTLGLTALAATVTTAAAIAVLLNGSTLDVTLWSPAPYIDFSLRMDALGAVFALTIGLVAAASAVFAIDYSSRNLTSDFTLPLFVLAMFCVVTAANVATFLFAWERWHFPASSSSSARACPAHVARPASSTPQ